MELAKVQGEYNQRVARALVAGDKKLAADLRASEKLVLAGVAEKYKDPKKPHVKADPEVAAYRTFSSQVDSLNVKAIEDASPALEKYMQGIAKLGDELNAYMAKNGDAAKASALFLTGQKALQAELDRDNAKSADALKAYQGAIDQQIAAHQQEIDLQVASIGMGAKEAQQLQDNARIRSQVASKIEQLNRQRAEKGADTKFIDAEIAAQKASIPILVKQEQDKWRAIEAAQADGMNGVNKAIADFMDQQKDMAGQMEDITTKLIGGFGDAFASFASGAESAKDAFGSLIDDMYKQALKAVANKALSSILGAFGFGTMSPGQSASLSSGAGDFVDSIFNAKGGVYSSPSLSQYSGQIVSKPTMFAFARGAGVMGEAGPEAIMPLRRMPNGKLGVETSDSGARSSSLQHAPVTVNQTIMVQGRVDRRTSQQIAQDSARQQRIAQTRNG